jgi:ABC-type transporter Mla subunit MlaD
MTDSIGTELQKRINQLLDAQVKVVDLTRSIDKAVIEFKSAGTITEATLEAFARTAHSATDALGDLAKVAGSLPAMKSEIESATSSFRQSVNLMQSTVSEFTKSASTASRAIITTPDEFRGKLDVTLADFDRRLTEHLEATASDAGYLPALKTEIDSAISLFRETVNSMQAVTSEFMSNASEVSRTIRDTPDELRVKLAAMLSEFDQRLMDEGNTAKNYRFGDNTSTFSGRLNLVVPSAVIAYLVAFFGFGLEVRDSIVLTFASFGGVLAGVSGVRVAREATEIIKGLTKRKGR